MYIIIFGIEGLLWKVYIYVYMEIFVICLGKCFLILCWNSLKIIFKDGGKIMLVC